jgi:8-oxo-dGTP diphosphatase
MPRIILVTAAIIVKEDRVLLARRPKFSHLAGLWEFPGGKVENGESPALCLQRELAEELEIRIYIDSVRRFDESYYEYGSKRVFLMGLTVGKFKGEPKPLEHAELAWVETKELELLPLAPADVPLARRLIRYSDTGSRTLRFTRRSNRSAGTGPLK